MENEKRKKDMNMNIYYDWTKKIIDEQTLLVSAMATNNETGIDLQIEEISELCV